jgi:hypothetical protein
MDAFMNIFPIPLRVPVSSLLVICTLLLAGNLLSGCSPQLGIRLPVPEVAGPERSEAVQGRGEPVRVRVGAFIDARPSDTMVRIDGRELAAEGSVTGAVQEGLERQLKSTGAQVVLFNAPAVEGEIVAWTMKITPKFPATEATAVAKLKLEVRGVGGRVLYRASYSGEATTAHPFPSESSMKELLGQAMGSAIEEVINDVQFVSALSEGRE